MIPTAEQTLQAVRNHHRPPVTRGARIRAALDHVRHSRKSKAANEAALQGAVAAHHTEVTRGY